MAGFCIAAWEKGVLQYCLLADNCIAIQLCQAGLRRQGLYRNTVQNIVTGDKGKRLGCVAIQHSQPRTRRCYARSKARRHGARTRPRYGSLALRHDQLGPATRPAGRPRYGAGRAVGAGRADAGAGALGAGARAEARGACGGDVAIQELSLGHDQGLGHDTAGSRPRYDRPWPRHSQANEPQYDHWCTLGAPGVPSWANLGVLCT